MTKSWPLAFFSFATGIALAYLGNWLVAVILLLCLILAGILFRSQSLRIGLCLLIAMAGMLYFSLAGHKVPQQLSVVERASLTGRVTSFSFSEADKTSFYFQPDQPEPYQKNLRVVCLFQPTISRGRSGSAERSA